MNAFRNIDSLLRVMAWGKDLLKFLFIGRKTPSLRQEQAVENFFSGDERRLNLLPAAVTATTLSFRALARWMLPTRESFLWYS